MKSLPYQYPSSVSITLSLFIFLSLSPLTETATRLIFLTLLMVFLNYGKIRRNSKFFSIEVFVPIICLFLLSIVSIFIFGLKIDYLKFLVTFYLVIFVSLSVLDSVGVDKILNVNFYFVGVLSLLTLPVFLLYYLGILIPDVFFDYQYGEYISKTIFVLNIHQYADGTYSGRFVGFGSEPGLTQLSWVMGLYYGVAKKLNKVLICALFLAIILGRSPIGIGFAVLILSKAYLFTWWGVGLLILGSLSAFNLISDWGALLQASGFSKFVGMYISLRFENDIVMLMSYQDYILPGGIYYKYIPTIIENFLSYGGLSQLIQRFGIIFVFMFFGLVMLRRFKLKMMVSLIFLSCTLITQSLFLNPLFYVFWYGVLYAEADLLRFLRVRRPVCGC